jgi:hypothetical protein
MKKYFKFTRPLFSLTITTVLLLSTEASKLKAQSPGPFELITPKPAGFSDANSLTPSALGVGRVKAPDGWGEFRYCDISGTLGSKGLIITKEYCQPNAVGVGAWNNDWIFDPSHTLFNGDNGEPKLSWGPVPYALGTIPFSYYSPLNTAGPNAASPTLNLRSFQQPILQARTVEYPNAYVQGSLKSRFIVMPDGNSGFNTEDPRAALDVQDANIKNIPVAIFGNVLPYSVTTLPQRTNTGGAPIKQTFTRHIAIIPRLGYMGYNAISHAEDIGLIFSNGLGFNGADSNGAIVIAPHTNSLNAGGLRIEHNGNAELRGDLRCTNVIVDTKWWPDYVFTKENKLRSLDSVSLFISRNGHLPDMPSQETIISKGQNLGNLQRLQQQKIEELTLYLIQLKTELDILKKELYENKKMQKAY